MRLDLCPQSAWELLIIFYEFFGQVLEQVLGQDLRQIFGQVLGQVL